jgi:Tol biopolymer transport system component
LKPSPPAGVVTRFPVVLPENQAFTQAAKHLVAISPDSTKLVYVANNQLYIRQMSEMVAQPIAGTQGGASNPFFSPDGQWVGFWSAPDSALKKIATSGGAAVTICKAGNPYGISWDGNDIVFSDPPKGILRVSENGGEPEVLVKMNPPEQPYSPQMLDHGKAVLFTLANGLARTTESWDQGQIVVQTLPTGERKTILRGGSDGHYVPSGHIIYALGVNILAVPFDLKRLELKGGSVPVVEGVMRSGTFISGAAQLAFSANGSAVYVPGSAGNSTTRTTLALVDLNGRLQPLPLPPAVYSHPRLSPDGKQLVVQTDDGKDQIVSVYEMSGSSTLRRLTFGGKNQFPIWSHDGRHVIFTSDREGDNGLFWQLADGTGSAERLTKVDRGSLSIAQSTDPSAKTLAFLTNFGTTGGISMLSLDGDHTPKPFVGTPNTIQPHAAFSPDGRWVVYSSTEVPPVQLFVQPYPGTQAKYQITADTGEAFPVWSPDGKQILYMSPFSQKFFVLDVRTEPSFSFGKASALPITGAVQPTPGMRNFDIAPDGKHLLVVMTASGTSQSEATPRGTNQCGTELARRTETARPGAIGP